VESAPVDEDVDPLDAYMQGIQEEVKRNRLKTVKANEKDNKVTVVVGIAKRSVGLKKGELIEQNQDGLEYSSEDEGTKEDDLANAMDNLQNKAKQKKLMTITKDDITYQPFRKNFYIEVPEINKMSTEEVEAFKAQMEGIKAKGKGCPKPIKLWAQCGVSKKVLDVLKRYGKFL
jgi:ATP-dependent RNA helicase DDX46/PRP5